MEPRFVLKPNIVAALAPHFFRWLWRFVVAAGIVYLCLFVLANLGYLLLPWWTLLVLATIALAGAFVHVKHRIIRFHRTTYSFYDNRVVEEFKLIGRKRQSVPYNQIKRVSHEQKLWQRLFDVADITIETEDDQGQKMVLQSIRDPEAIEHRIYELMGITRSDSTRS